ncbi:lysostaphin resistance A-like protein [Marinobacter sp.]|uniref:CPBP family intramembrane glutamic endopeptidase n=1 Tax=Marinobacter sp. TaxID=50741 RepID=UPI00384F01E6
MANAGARISSSAALLFQGGIVVVALLGIVIFGVEVHRGSLPAAVAFVLGSAGGMATFALLWGLSRLGGFFPSKLKSHVRELHQFARGFSWPVIICLSALAGVGEELLFRGLIQGWLAEAGNEAFGVAVAALLFGLLHFLSLAYFMAATLMGVLLGAAYVVSESIFLVIVWHGVYDLVALVFLRDFPHLLGMNEEG